MYTGKHAHLRPLQPAFIMASTGEAVTYRELEARTLLARALLEQGKVDEARQEAGRAEPLAQGSQHRSASLAFSSSNKLFARALPICSPMKVMALTSWLE